MDHEIDDKLRQQFGRNFVEVSSVVSDADERGRLREKGTTLMLEQLPILERLYEEGLRIPHLDVVPRNGKIVPASIKKEGRHAVITLTVDDTHAPDDLRRLLCDYAANTVSREELEQTPARQNLQEADLSRTDREAPTGFGFYGHRSTYDLTTGPDRKKIHKNTIGDLAHYGQMRQEDPQEWQFWLDYLFSNKQLKHFSAGDWLRSVRVLAGVKIEDIERVIGINNSAYSRYENAKVHGGCLTLDHCRALLSKNLFHWPEDETGKVGLEYAEKFMTKMGHPEIDGQTFTLRREWLERQPVEKQGGLLLAYYRKQSHKSQDELAASMHVARSDKVSAWENATKEIPPSVLPELMAVLSSWGCDVDGDYFQRIVARSNQAIRNNKLVKTLVKAGGASSKEKPLRQTITDQEGGGTLNPDWMETLPVANQVRAFLSYLLERAGMTRLMLAQKLGINASVISHWQNGNWRVSDKYIPQLIEVFKMEGVQFDPEYLREIIARSNEEVSKKHALTNTESTQMGALHHISKRQRPHVSVPKYKGIG